MSIKLNLRSFKILLNYYESMKLYEKRDAIKRELNQRIMLGLVETDKW